MHHIFVSYSRSDGPWVRSLVERLERNRLAVWLDQKDIPVTVPWLAEIEDAIEEAALFLRCDSAAFRRSASCSVEVGLASQTAKPQFVVTVGADVDDCAARIAQTALGISTARNRRTELRVLARDWDRAGRPGNRLVSRGHRRRLSAGLQVPPQATEPERSFLHTSRSRTRRRALVTTVLLTLIATSFLTTEVFRTAQSKINSDNRQEAMGFTQEQSSLGLVSQDPYRGLQTAAQDGGNEADVHAEVVSAALAQPTPDDAFAVPKARRFAVRPIGAQVIVLTADGREWAHSSASAAIGRRARELRRFVAVSPSQTVAGLTARAERQSGTVKVRRNDQAWRTISFDAVPNALAFSPDGRFLAASVSQQVEIADISSGEVRTYLRGANRPLLDVAWSADGRHIWALSRSMVFSWLTGSSYTLVDHPGADYNSVLPAANPLAVWIVSAHALTEISVATGAVLARKKIRDTLYTAGAAPDGSVALISGERYLWAVPLSGRTRPRHIHLPGCSLGRPTFSGDSLAYLPCIGGDLLVLSMPAEKVIKTVDVSPSGLFSATAVPHSDLVYAGDQAGYLYVIRDDRVTRIQASECDIEVTRIAVAPGDRAVLPVGSGSGMSTCTKVGLHNAGDPADPANWTWNAVIEQEEQSVFGSATSFSPHGGSFAIGYTDGTITMHPTRNITPTLVVNNADGVIRDMLTLANGDLIIVTNTGMVQRLLLCDTCISDASLSKVAAAHLKLAVRLGLTVSRRA
ncbi:MAG TPA: toll/interleukin-1 receptor domain-containing protein [Streptosporangiaceae bacterium]|nr:toll/interleukin-1 receptor domain-containing protein [Streptosporangiaceae bacterium]